MVGLGAAAGPSMGGVVGLIPSLPATSPFASLGAGAGAGASESKAGLSAWSSIPISESESSDPSITLGNSALCSSVSC